MQKRLLSSRRREALVAQRYCIVMLIRWATHNSCLEVNENILTIARIKAFIICFI